MTDRSVPDAIMHGWPRVPAGDWKRFSATEFWAPHPTIPDALLLVVAGDAGVGVEPLGQAVRRAEADREHMAETFARLATTLARTVEQELACRNGNPITAGSTCVRCGLRAEMHELPNPGFAGE